MSVTVKPVSNRRELRIFADYPNKLYSGNPYFVPKIYKDELDTFNPRKNAAYEFSEAELFLAWKDGKVVGRVAAIINNLANKQWGHKEVRFGWIDFIDDREVSAALLDAVEQFGKKRGMTRLVGPLGFTDFDPEGMLVRGFDRISTMALIYNYPYYPEHMEALGLVKEVDWVENRITVPEQIPDKVSRISKIVMDKYDVHIRKVTRREINRMGMGQTIFNLINECYKDLYNFTLLPPGMIEHYVHNYLAVLDLEYLTLIADKDDNILAFGVAMPSIAKALQKCRGKYFPFGWWHILKALYLKHDDTSELLLIGVKPEYQSKGLLALIFYDLIPRFNKAGFKYGETNAILETNQKNLTHWSMFEYEQEKKRRIYGKDI